MKAYVLAFLFCLGSTSEVLARYSLPAIDERMVLLLDSKEVKVDEKGSILTVTKANRGFQIDRFWLQHYVWSDGLCVGITASDPKSSATRIRQVQAALKKKSSSPLLVEIIRLSKTKEYRVSYIQLFDQEAEFKRYSGNKAKHGSIKLGLASQPKDSWDLLAKLQGMTSNSLTKLKKAKSQ